MEIEKKEAFNLLKAMKNNLLSHLQKVFKRNRIFSISEFLLLYGKMNTSAKPFFLILYRKLGPEKKVSKKYFIISKKSNHSFNTIVRKLIQKGKRGL